MRVVQAFIIVDAYIASNRSHMVRGINTLACITLLSDEFRSSATSSLVLYCCKMNCTVLNKLRIAQLLRVQVSAQL